MLVFHPDEEGRIPSPWRSALLHLFPDAGCGDVGRPDRNDRAGLGCMRVSTMPIFERALTLCGLRSRAAVSLPGRMRTASIRVSKLSTNFWTKPVKSAGQEYSLKLILALSRASRQRD